MLESSVLTALLAVAVQLTAIVRQTPKTVNRNRSNWPKAETAVYSVDTLLVLLITCTNPLRCQIVEWNNATPHLPAPLVHWSLFGNLLRCRCDNSLNPPTALNQHHFILYSLHCLLLLQSSHVGQN